MAHSHTHDGGHAHDHGHDHGEAAHDHGNWTRDHVFLGAGHGRSESKARLAALVTAIFMLVEIASGLSRNDRVIDNPPDSIRAGDQVRIATAGADGGGHGQP